MRDVLRRRHHGDAEPVQEHGGSFGESRSFKVPQRGDVAELRYVHAEAVLHDAGALHHRLSGVLEHHEMASGQTNGLRNKSVAMLDAGRFDSYFDNGLFPHLDHLDHLHHASQPSASLY